MNLVLERPVYYMGLYLLVPVKETTYPNIRDYIFPERVFQGSHFLMYLQPPIPTHHHPPTHNGSTYYIVYPTISY